MSSSREDLKGLPEIYLSPSRSSISSGHGGLPPSDTELNVLDDTDSEVWTTLVPEMTATDGVQLSAVSSEGDSPELSLGQREEIEGVSSIDSPLNSNNFSSNRSQTFYLPREPEGSRTFSTADPSQSTDAASRQNVVEANSDGHWKHQRGETPGSDCPPTVGIGALSRVFRQPLDLNINNALSSKNELIFSPGGDEGFMVPGGVCAYYGTGSGSDTDWLDWNSADDGAAQALSPSRDVEGADSTTASAQVYAGNALPTRTGLENMERNSPAGLSTPDAEVDLRYRAGGRRGTASQAKTKSNIRPPVVGQSEENALTATRKDLGSTDGEESEDDGGQKRLTLLRDNILSDIQLSSLGSQSENTDSVNTVLDMSRGEVQGCETDSTGDTLLLSPSQVLETGSLQHNPKPTFVVGGLIAPRGKHKVFQNTIRGRMLDMMASLELEPNLEAKVFVDRDHFLSQPPLGPQVSTVSEQETSLASMVSVESTNHPESSDRVTSPSVLSVSSAASSKRLEWDSGADVGYAGNTPEQITSSLSTLERIALGSYASVLRTEPEGTTHVADKQKPTRKSAKGMSVKSAGTVSHSKRSNQEKPTASSISKSHRGQHSKERYKMSSSEEDFDGRFSSPANSPRRRPRKRPTASNSRKLDLPVKSSAGKTKKTFGRLHEILQELNSEGKASSLVELNRTSRPASEYRRSNSQQSLLYSGDTSDKRTEAVASMSTAVGSSTSVVTAVCCRAKPESSSASGNATSTAEASSKLKLESKSNKAWESKKSQQSLKLQKITAVTRNQEKVFLSSSNEVSSKSRGSSDNETLSDVKDTEGDSCPSSNLVSDEEPVNLKARKNSENAKNHENITKLNLRSSGSKSDQCRAQKKNEDSSSSSSLQRSFLESQVSIQSSNNSLQALSVRLREKIQALLDSGTVKKVQDYNKLQDYVAFIGMPSTSEEECQLKHGVASVIMRMFGEIEDDTDASNLTSETSDPVTPSSPSDYKAENMSVNTLCSHDDVDISPGVDTLKKEESGLLSVCPSSQVPLSTENGAGNSSRIVSTASKGGVTSSEGSRSVTPSDTVKLVPYRPPSATRTYFMAVSCNLEEGMVEGERVTTPEGVVLSPRGSNDQQDDLRGQAEGQRELVTDDSELSSPTSYQRESRMKDAEEVHEGECYNMSEGETSISVVLTARQDDLRGQAEGQRDIIRDDSEQSSPTAYRSDARIEDHRQPSEENDKVIPVKDSEDEESVSVSGATALPQEWSNVMNSQMRSNILPGSVTSDESSPRHVWPSTWDRQSKWHEDEKETRSEEAIGWKYATTRSESLYKDKLGTLHVAKQPPGYADDRDSHQSESLSDHEPHQLCANDTESQDDRRPYGHPWTSSGSESAYETIRERHRHVDEALASSFEFYSTSPRDARLLGYISSEAEKDKEEEVDCEMEDQLDEEQISELSPLKSELQPVEEYSAQKSGKSKTHSSDKNDGSRDSTRFISSFSSHTDEDLSSSQISFIKLQKHRYVRRIQHYIDSLEKLERVLVAQFGDSIGSEKSFQRYVTEGRSHTESDSNKTQTRDILGSSSIASSDLSDDGIHRKVPLPRWRRKGVLSRSNAHSESHDIPAILTRRSEEGAGGPLQQSSLVSSPRISISHRSSDIVSSRTSTLKQIEKEVRMLALAEEKSRHAIRKSGKPKSSGSRKMGRYDVQRMQREEPRGEEDPVRSLVSSRRGTLDSNLSSKFCAPDHVPSPKRPTKKKERVPKAADASQVSEEEISSQSISDSQISRRGDGRETGDAKQQLTSQAAVTAYGTRTSYKQSSVVNSSSNRDNPPSKSNSVQTSRLDFGQMFPSTECLRPNSFLYAHSVGIQTGTSLLCLDDRENECRGKFSSITSSFSQKNKKQRDSCVSIVQEKEIATIQEPHSTGGGDSHDQSSSESAVLGFTDRNIPTGSSFDGQENGRLQSYEEGKTKEKRSEYSDKTEITTAKNLEAEDNQVSQKMTQSFQPSNVQHTAEISGSRSVKVPKLVTTSRSTEQNLNEPNVLYSVPCSGRTAMISKEKASAGQGTSKEALSGYSSEEWRESVCEVQNEVSDSDCNRNEYGLAKIGPAGSNFKAPEKGVTETTNSSSPAQVYSENNRSSSLAKRNRHTNEESSSLQQLCDSVQIPEGDLDHDARRYRGGQDQLPGAVHQQHELQETMLPQSPQNNRYIHVRQMDQSSGVSQTYGNEGDVVRNPKNCLVVINDNQLIPSKNIVESMSELGLAHVGSYAGRGLEHSTKRSIDSGQISAHAASKKAPVTFEVNVNDKENVYKEVLKSKVSSHQETRLCIDTTKHITLQEALLKARPDYVREAGERRALIRLKQELRQVAQSRNHDIISQIPTNLQTPSTLQRFLYKPDIAPLFSYRDIREQNRRLYQLLPEASMNQMRSQCTAKDRTNRLIAKMYSQKLRNKVLKGQVSHAHKDIVSTTPAQRK
ncbi:serine-rich adhesin for platelets-like isoform X3 [Macrobrachium rosenbergii]|uniref:serine-rich adhesin for platelets-like isoform X3 n=1 Tax=Macrobrachium rosenbergii TaxID=79674 RepID=UPI0034D53F97